MQTVFAQTGMDVKGTVTDDKGSPLSNVSVVIKGTTKGVTTDANGAFSINVPSSTSVLVISYIGYQSQEITVGQNTNLNINLVSAATQLSDVVVVGYGTQKKLTVTGSVAQVRGSELAKSPTANLSNSLAGRLPGVTAVQSSGEPGYDGSAIHIRGVNSYGNSDALIVIDGVPNRAGGLQRLNPQDIESVSILKDAAAAIYGSRAGNGVILITTKRGKSGKPSVSYDFNYGWEQPTRTPQMATAPEYATIRNELTIYDNVPAAEWEAAFQAFQTTGTYTTQEGRVVPAVYTQEEIKKFADGSDPLHYPNTDWYKSVLKTWSPQTKQNLQVSGGSENIKYLASLGYTNQDGYYKNSATGYKQYDMRINVDAKINKYITTSLGVLAREEYRHFPNGGGAGDIFRMTMRGKPTEIAVWPNGLPGPDIENGQNPVVITTDATGYYKDKRDFLQTNGKVEIQIPWVEGLKVTGTAAIDKTSSTVRSWQTPWTLYYWDGTSFEDDGTTPVLKGSVRSTFNDPRLSQNASQDLAINLVGTVDYSHTFGGVHAVTALAGVQREKVEADGLTAFRRYFISPAIDQLFAGGALAQSIGKVNLYQRARLSYFGRLGYNYKEKYIAEFLWRYDGSYLFPEERRFGFFPGITAGWRISEENFFKNNVHFMDNLKLRGSWGQMGAEPYYSGVLAEYQYLSNMAFGTYILNDQIAKTLYETVVPNTDFTWEVANNYDIGLDGSLLRNKLSFELDYFYNKRSGILTYLGGSIPQSSGITDKLPPVNYGRMINRGGEFKITYNDRVGDFTYSVSINGGYAKNKIIDWNETPGIPTYQQSTGSPYGAFLAYRYDGVFATQSDIDKNKIDYSGMTGNLLPGDMKIKDVNGDGKINGDDQVRLDKTNTPTFTGGININLQYKNFDLSVLFQGAKGGLQFIGRTESGDIGNFLQYAYDHRWTIDHPSAVDPRLTNRQNRYYTGGSAWNNDYFLKPNDYLRLKNIEIGYSLSERLSNKAGISNLRVYVSGLNVFTFFDKIKIWDPEATTQDGKYYPQARILSTGVRVTF
ncbi:MAG: SusC/RagA family TonB-linked outer membrane protein [Ilyomonas sp.]